MRYFSHLVAYPHENCLPETFFDEMKGLITWYLTGMNLPFKKIIRCADLASTPFHSDSYTSLSSMSPYGKEEMEKLLDLLDRIEGNHAASPRSKPYSCFPLQTDMQHTRLLQVVSSH